VQPAAGDAGGALGAALAAHHLHKGQPRATDNRLDRMHGSYLGPTFDDDDIAQRLSAAGARFVHLEDDTLIDRTSNDIASGLALGWFQGRMEFGPRALGNRSIIADARNPRMQSLLNLKVKYRESFRPFAPAVLRHDVADWFELDEDSPYMLMVADVVQRRRRRMTAAEKSLFGIDKLNVPRSEIPAVTHIDYSARVQTVHAETNPRFHALLSTLKHKTGCPVVVNTSFNIRGEPIVCTPEDAFRCFMGTQLDALAIGNLYLAKADQDAALKREYKGAFDLD
jgi:carbamoyltransferase